MKVKKLLPKQRWKVCPVCEGTGRVFLEGDLHRSRGWVPCPDLCCEQGIKKYTIVEAREAPWKKKP